MIIILLIAADRPPAGGLDKWVQPMESLLEIAECALHKQFPWWCCVEEI